MLCAIALLLAGCSSEEIPGVGPQPDPTSPGTSSPIAFGAGAGAVTRAQLTGGDAAALLDSVFAVYGMKTLISGTDTIRTEVFPSWTVAYTGALNAGQVGANESNSKGWQYVGLTGFATQSVRYWDPNADNYTFQAWAITNRADVVGQTSTAGNTEPAPDDPTVIVNPDTARVKVLAGTDTLTVSGNGKAITHLYFADKVKVNHSAMTQGVNTFGGVVTFTFRRQTAQVRFGMYESIPGYKVSSITFRSANNLFGNSGTNAIVDGLFTDVGTQTYKVGYDDSGKAVLQRTGYPLVAAYKDFGSFTTWPYTQNGTTITPWLSNDSNNPTWAAGGYQAMLPNNEFPSDVTLYINFSLRSDDPNSEDSIRVRGAMVTVPADLMAWKPNFAYTYLFNITKNTNGTTGTEGSSPVGLYPITFDAIVLDEATGTSTTYHDVFVNAPATTGNSSGTEDDTTP